MGFGILIIGYFLTFATALSTSYFFADIPGAVLIVYAVSKLSKYSDGFKKTFPIAATFSVSCVLCAVFRLMNVGGIYFDIAIAFRTALVLVLHVFLFRSLEVMASGADDEKLAGKAKRNTGMVTAYYLFYICYTFMAPMLDEAILGYFDFFMFVFNVAVVVLNLLLIHSAYARLYIEGSDNNEAFPEFKESKIPFVNPIKRSFYESQKKAHEENARLMREAMEHPKGNSTSNNKKKKKH